MSDRFWFREEDSRRLIVAILDFLKNQLNIRDDFLRENRRYLNEAIQILEMAYGLYPNRNVQLKISRPLLDSFSQLTNPVPVRDMLRAVVHKDEGNKHMSKNRYQDAEAEYTAAIKLDRWDSIYYCNRAGAKIEQQHYYDAILDCRKALILNPDYAKACERMGQAFALLDRTREAAKCFRRALRLDPGNERYRNNLRVAENQLNLADVLGAFSGVMSSTFGTSFQTAPRVSSGTRMPSSFVIFADIPPPARFPSQRNTQPDQNDGETIITERNAPVSPPIALIRPFGATRSNSARSSPAQVDPSLDTEYEEEVEKVVRVPEYSFFPDEDSVNDPCEDGYDFTSKEPGKINNATTRLEKYESTFTDTDVDEAGMSLGVKKSQPKVEKDAEISKLSALENNENIVTHTSKAQDPVLEHIASQMLYGSTGIKSSQPNIEKCAESSELLAPVINKDFTTDEPKAQDTDSKHIPSHTTGEQRFVVRWPTNDEWNKFQEDDESTVASPSDMESPTAEKNEDNISGLLEADSETANETGKSCKSEV